MFVVACAIAVARYANTDLERRVRFNRRYARPNANREYVIHRGGHRYRDEKRLRAQCGSTKKFPLARRDV